MNNYKLDNFLFWGRKVKNDKALKMSDWKESCAFSRNWDINQNVSYQWVLAFTELTLV